MRFSCDDRSTHASSCHVIYRVQDYSFDCIPIDHIDQTKVFSIAIDTLQVDFNIDSQVAVGIYGYYPISFNKRKVIKPPVAQHCSLHVDLMHTPIPGMAYELQGGELWESSFDLQSGWVCISKKDDHIFQPHDTAIEFITDTIAVLRNSELVMLWIRPEITD